ncbi:MAG: DUF2853 family protein [Polaribacter sp.]|nr:DUF2853 family protein [Polaribacter sp.]
MYKKFIDDCDIRSNTELLAAITRGLGPFIYDVDSVIVAGSDLIGIGTIKISFFD